MNYRVHPRRDCETGAAGRGDPSTTEQCLAAAAAIAPMSMREIDAEVKTEARIRATADAVLFGSGIKTREIARDAALLARLRLDPSRQLIGAQCSGTLLLAKLGLLGDLPACTDLTTKPWVIEAGVRVLDQPFFATGNLATAAESGGIGRHHPT